MDLTEAMAALLPEVRAGFTDTDLIAAALESMRRRRDNSAQGGAVFAELRRRTDPDTGKPYTLRKLAELTGIPKDTLGRWADEPGT